MFGRDLKFAMVKLLTDPDKTLEDLPELLADPEIPAVNATQQQNSKSCSRA